MHLLNDAHLTQAAKIVSGGLCVFVANLQNADNELILRLMTALEPAESVSVWVFKDLYREANETLDAISRQLRKQFPHQKIESIVTEGKPKESIVREAEDWCADLILIGSHNKRGIGKFLLGSVAASVVPDSPCNVVLLAKAKSAKSNSGIQTVKKHSISS